MAATRDALRCRHALRQHGCKKQISQAAWHDISMVVDDAMQKQPLPVMSAHNAIFPSKSVNCKEAKGVQ